jgi:hypothetical protein
VTGLSPGSDGVSDTADQARRQRVNPLGICKISKRIRNSASLWTGWSGDLIPVGRDFPHPSTPSLGPTQSPVQRVPVLNKNKIVSGFSQTQPYIFIFILS